MVDRFAQFPSFLAQRTRSVRFGDVPAMVALPDGAEARPVPAVLWIHGRTANKELDPGRYMRWLRAGMAAVAIDLPGHGERLEAAMQEPAQTLNVLEQALGEVNGVVAGMRRIAGIDGSRMAIGGMSLGGMVTLRRLCEPHGFIAASVEGTCGWLTGMYFPKEHGLAVPAWPVDHPREKVKRLDTGEHLDGFRPIPTLVLHSEADEMVPWAVQSKFVEKLRARFGAEADKVSVTTWPTTGAPREHIGFGRFSNDAKNIQTEFFARVLGAEVRTE